MKRFSKVLALVLALITALTVLPISAIADSWLDVDAEKLPEKDATHVTVTLDAKLLADLLTTDGISDGLIQKLLDAADVDRETLGKIFTLEELYGIVPREKIVEILDLKTIIETIGLEKLNTYIDLPALLAGCDKNKLAGLLQGIPDLQNYADVERLIAEKYIPNDIILKHVKEAELKNAAASIKPEDIVPAIMKLSFAEIKEIVDVYAIVDKGLIAPLTVVNMEAAQKRAEAMFKDSTFNVNDYMTYINSDNAIAYFKKKYGTLELDSLASLSSIRELITNHYIDVKFTYHIESVNLLALIDATYMDGKVEKHFLDASDFEHKVHDYLVEKFKALTPEQLKGYADAGCFTYEYNALTGTATILSVDMHEVLEHPELVSIAELRANPALGVDAYLEAKVDEWIHNDDAYHKLVENSKLDESERFVTVTVDKNVTVSSVDYQKLIRDKKVDAAELLSATPAIVDVNGLAKKLIEEGKLNGADGKFDRELTNNELLLAEIKKIAPATLIAYVNIPAAVEKFGTEQVITWLGGVEKAMACIDVPGVTKDILAILPTILENLTANGVALTDIFYLDKLLPKLDFQKIMEIVGIDNVLVQLDTNELKELLKLIDIKSKIEPLMVLFYNYGMKNINKLTVNGLVVAETDDLALLKFDAKALVEAVRMSIPTLEEIAKLETNVITSVEVEMEYTPEGTTDLAKKHWVFDFALGSGLDKVKNAAQDLQTLLDRYVNELTVTSDRVTVDISIPEKFAELYALLLEDAEISPALKEKILNVTNLTGDEMIGFIEKELTLADILEVLSAVEPEAVYELVKNSELLAKLLEKLDKSIPDMTMEELWAAIGSREYSLENICAAIEERTERDIRELLKAIAPVVDDAWSRTKKITAVSELLAKIESKLGFTIVDMTAEEFVDNEWNTDLVDTLSRVISKRVVTNVRSIICDNTLTELWDLAIAKAEERSDIYVKVRNYLIRALNKMPESVAACSISDLYQTNGIFSGDKTVNASLKAVIEKVVTKVANRVTIPEKAQKAVDLFMSRVDDVTVNTKVSVTLRFTNFFKITYMSADKSTELFTAFLPTGTVLSVYAYKPTADEEFLGWVDAEGNAVSAMPAADTVVYASLKGYTPPVEEYVTLTFAVKNGEDTVLSTVKIKKGASLNTAEMKVLLATIEDLADAALPAISDENKVLYRNFRVAWSFGTDGYIDRTKGIGLDHAFDEDTTLYAKRAFDHSVQFSDPDINYRNEYDATTKTYRTVILDETFRDNYHVGIKHILLLAEADSEFTYEIRVESANTGTFSFAHFENETLRSLHAVTLDEDYVWFAYTQYPTKPTAFAGTVFEGKDMTVYTFDFTVTESELYHDGTVEVVKAAFRGQDVSIILPYATAKKDSSYTTRVYTNPETGTGREYVRTEILEDGFVVFHALHFSDFIVADEYKLDLKFYPDTVSGALAGAYADTEGNCYLLAGTEVELLFAINDPEGKEIVKITDQEGNVYALGSILTMPEKDLTLTLEIFRHVYYIYYYYYDAALGKMMPAAPTYSYIKETLDMSKLIPETIFAEALAATPAGYDKLSYKWTSINEDLLLQEDISVFLTWAPISYTLTFKDTDGNVLGTITDLTAENYATKYALPAIPAGMVGAWTVTEINRPADLTVKTDNEITVVLRGDFTAATFPIVSDQFVSAETPKFAAAGETITVSALDRFGYTAVITVKTDAGDLVELVDGTFTMPAAMVRIDVVYVANTIIYTVNGEERTGAYMDTVTLVIKLKPNQVLSTKPNDCTLASTDKTDAETVLTYTFLLDGEKEIEYKIETVKALIFRVFNGTLFNGVLPEPGENLKFERWSTPLYDVLYFAVFSLAQVQASMLWLWILAAVLFVLLLIVLLYVLGQYGKTLGFLTRFAIWVVELFFSLCILMAKLALKIASLFGKSKNPTDYGFTKQDSSKSKRKSK